MHCKTLSSLALAALLAACAQAPAQPQPPAPVPSHAAPAATTPSSPKEPPMDLARTLPAYDWSLDAVRGPGGQAQPGWLLAGRPALQLQFDDGRLSVRHLCNVLGAGYQLADERITVTHAMSTKRLCAEPGLMTLEARVGAQLPRAQRLQLRPGARADAPQLVLSFDDGTRWELTGSATPATRYGSAGERVFLEVAPETVPCHHPLMPAAQCLRVRELRYDERGLRQGEPGPWQVLQGSIEGYQHRRGVRNVLRLQRYPAAPNGQPPAADAPGYAYVLDMVVVTEQVGTP